MKIDVQNATPSQNGGSPKWMVYNGKSRGPPISGNLQMMGKTWYPTFRHRDPTTDPGGDPSVSQSPQVEGLVPDVQRVTKVGQLYHAGAATVVAGSDLRTGHQ